MDHLKFETPDMVAGNIDKIADISQWEKICFNQDVFAIDESDRAFCRQAVDLLPAGDFDETTFGLWTAAIKEKTGKKDISGID